MEEAIFENTDCEFCGKIQPYIYGTVFGAYCKECLELFKQEAEEGIEALESKTDLT